MGNDIDFIIKVDGNDVTKQVMKWVLKEVDDGTSSINIMIANPNFMYSGVFGFGGDVDLMFGNEGLTEHIYGMAVTSITEDYALGKPVISVRAEDSTRNLEEGSAQGMFPKGTKMKDAVKSIAQMAGLRLRLKGMEEAEFYEHLKLALIPGGSVGENLTFYARMFRRTK